MRFANSTVVLSLNQNGFSEEAQLLACVCVSFVGLCLSFNSSQALMLVLKTLMLSGSKFQDPRIQKMFLKEFWIQLLM